MTSAASDEDDGEGHQFHANCFPLAFSENVTYKLYDSTGKSTEMTAFRYTGATIYHDNADHPFVDVFPKVQLHAADNKVEDGAGVLLFFEGMESLPNTALAARPWHLSDDDPAIYATLNDGKPCWECRWTGDNITSTFSIPSFRRYSPTLDKSWDFGKPQEFFYYPMEDETLPDPTSFVYERMWDSYIADRYDRDTRVCDCMVDLNGMKVDNELLFRFYWFDNCYWVLNRIINYSYTTNGLTECEFIKVQDFNSYERQEY